MGGSAGGSQNLARHRRTPQDAAVCAVLDEGAAIKREIERLERGEVQLTDARCGRKLCGLNTSRACRSCSKKTGLPTGG